MLMHAREQACEDCGLQVNFQCSSGAEGLPDFITVTFPDDAWVGWNWAVPFPERKADTKPELVVLCSKSCLVHWFAGEEGPGA